MNNSFLQQYAEAATTTLGFFWMAFWAFSLGYIVSSMIQVFVTQQRMQTTMGSKESKGVLLGTVFGFISSSCSFAALATTKSLFKKGAGFIPAIAFLLASTNLVIELGILIVIFLAWQFAVGEYVGGILLILIAWLFIRIAKPDKLIKKARKRLEQPEEEKEDIPDWKNEIKKLRGWQKVAHQYFMEWKMVWKDVAVGFTIAGIISAFVPQSFFEWLFINSGSQGSGGADFPTLLEHVAVGPVAAFCTFIGSMGNIPLASLLYSNGVSFAGVMAFIFSDLVVFPVLRINAKYYGWKMALYILLILFISLVATSLLLHYGMQLFDLLPETTGKSVAGQDYFKINYTFFLNLGFLLITGFFAWLAFIKKKLGKGHHGHEMPSQGVIEPILKYLAFGGFAWLAGGLVVKWFVL